MRIACDLLELRTRHSFAIARAASIPIRRSLWIRIADAEGIEGWGEAPVSTPYYGETAESARIVLDRFSELLAEDPAIDPFALERLERTLEERIGGNRAAKAGISAALHDLLGKRLGEPLWRLWGLDPVAPRSSFTIAIEELDRMRERVREADSYPILKVKVGTRRDAEVLRMIREEAPQKRVWVDANTAWSAKQAIGALPMLEEFGIELIEQPVAPGDLEGLRAVRSAARVPVIADESCRTASDIPRLVGAVDGINLKLAKCGSVREALRMVAVARAHHLQVMLGCMVESTLGIAAAVQLAPLVDFIDLDGAALLAADPFQGPGIGSDGAVLFNQSPGLGVMLAPA